MSVSVLIDFFFPFSVHEQKLVLPLRREKGHSNCGEIEIELNDLHMQLSTSPSEGQDNNRTTVTANATSSATQNGPTSSTANSAAVAGTVAALTNDVNLMQLDSPATDRRAGSQSPAGTTPTTTPTTTAGATSTQTTASATERQTGLAVGGAAAVTAVGGAAAVATATSGNTRVPTPTPPAPTNTPSQVRRSWV